MVTELARIKGDGVNLREAVAAYEEEVFARGRKAVLESLEDADALMKTHDVAQSRIAKQGFSR